VSKEHHDGYRSDIKAEYEKVRTQYAAQASAKNFVAIDVARKNALRIDWNNENIAEPKEKGVHIFKNVLLNELVPYIDWTPFFQTWELAGRFPAILEDEIVGEEASKLYHDAQKMLDALVSENKLEARAVIGIFEANAVGDDIEINTGEKTYTVHTLRQQTKKAEGQANLALADFIAPKTSGKKDYLGCFAVCTGFGLDALVKKFEADHDDYSSILAKALADRLAEALAEYMHKKVRTEVWAYAENESLDYEALINEKYQGIRPAPGYPACPDHQQKLTIWEMLHVKENIGIELTDSLAMYPTAAVSGFYFASPHSKYFGLGKIAKDQVSDYAGRRKQAIEQAERWLSPNLNY
jgi:5-methyltetrahydrofolate--homocysteine methyltransferase